MQDENDDDTDVRRGPGGDVEDGGAGDTGAEDVPAEDQAQSDVPEEDRGPVPDTADRPPEREVGETGATEPGPTATEGDETDPAATSDDEQL